MAESQAFRDGSNQNRDDQPREGCLQNPKFLVTAEGILKIIEFVCLTFFE